MSDYLKDSARPPVQPDAPTPPANEVLVPTNEALRRRAKSGGTWLWFIAGASLVNIILSLVEAPIRFFVGLTTIDFVQAFGNAAGLIFTYVALALNLAMLGALAFFAFQAQKIRPWAHVAGVVALGLDTVVLFILMVMFSAVELWPTVIHLIALYFLVLGLKSARLLDQRRQQGLA